MSANPHLHVVGKESSSKIGSKKSNDPRGGHSRDLAWLVRTEDDRLTVTDDGQKIRAIFFVLDP